MAWPDSNAFWDWTERHPFLGWLAILAVFWLILVTLGVLPVLPPWVAR